MIVFELVRHYPSSGRETIGIYSSKDKARIKMIHEAKKAKFLDTEVTYKPNSVIVHWVSSFCLYAHKIK